MDKIDRSYTMFGGTAFLMDTDNGQVIHCSPLARQTDENTVPSAGRLQPPAHHQSPGNLPTRRQAFHITTSELSKLFEVGKNTQRM